jgi:hypothetical protein
MNGNAMRKKLGPVADDIAMFLSGIDGFPPRPPGFLRSRGKDVDEHCGLQNAVAPLAPLFR